MENNNGLIVVTKSIFDKIKNFFKRLFSKNEILSSKSSNTQEETVETENTIEIEAIEIDTIKNKEKKEFFKKYQDYKDGKINTSDFSGSEKVKIGMMLDEELNLSQKKFEEAMRQYNMVNN